MVEWFKGSLGDPGTFVPPHQMQQFGETWKYRFGATALLEPSSSGLLEPSQPSDAAVVSAGQTTMTAVPSDTIDERPVSTSAWGMPKDQDPPTAFVRAP